MFKTILLLFTLNTLILTTLAQNNMPIIWQQCFGVSGYNETATGIVETENGYIIIGYVQGTDGSITNYHGSDDIWLIRIDSIGNLLWERAYGGSGSELSTNIIKDNYGFYYFGGSTLSNNGDVQSTRFGGYDRWVVKIDIEGNIIWERCYGGSSIEYGGVLKLLRNGNIMITGATTSNDFDVPIHYGLLDDWLLIINPDGDIIESRVYGNISQNNIFDIVETNDSGFFFTSKADDTSGMINGVLHGLDDVWIVKLDSTLDIEWQKLYGGGHFDYGCRGVLELEDGYIFLAQTESNDFDVTGFHGIPGDNPDVWVVRIDTIGDIIWERCIGGYGYEYSEVIRQTEDSGFIVFATTSSNDGDVSGNHGNPPHYNDDIWMVKLNADGEIEWQQCYGGIGFEGTTIGVIKKSDDNWVIASRATNNNTGDVNCNLHGLKDYWVFEIKDCSHYQPSTPQQPTGKNHLCVNTDSITTYTTPVANGAWGYEWEIIPPEAGILEADSITAKTHWSATYQGTATIKVRSYNDCGTSPWSDSIAVETYMCLGTEEYETALHAITAYPNPVSNSLTVYYRNQATNKPIIIELLDMYGNIVIKQNINKGKHMVDIDVTSLAKSLYLVRAIIDGEVVGVRKVIVE